MNNTVYICGLNHAILALQNAEVYAGGPLPLSRQPYKATPFLDQSPKPRPVRRLIKLFHQIIIVRRIRCRLQHAFRKRVLHHNNISPCILPTLLPLFHPTTSKSTTHLLTIPVLQKRVKHINLLQLSLLIEFLRRWYRSLRLIRNYIVFGPCGWGGGGEALVDAVTDGFLKGDLGAEGVDGPLGEGAEIVFVDYLEGWAIRISIGLDKMSCCVTLTALAIMKEWFRGHEAHHRVREQSIKRPKEA